MARFPACVLTTAQMDTSLPPRPLFLPWEGSRRVILFISLSGTVVGAPTVCQALLKAERKPDLGPLPLELPGGKDRN